MQIRGGLVGQFWVPFNTVVTASLQTLVPGREVKIADYMANLAR